MTLNDLLEAKDIDPRYVLVLRHRPNERELSKRLPWLAAEKPDLFNAYQQTQTKRVERAMQAMVGKGYIASFIGREAGTALFVGLYSIGQSTPLSREQFWKVPAYVDLKPLGMRGFADEDTEGPVLWFDLRLTDFYAHCKGKLIVSWPPPERAWWRRAHRNEIPVIAILEESALDGAIPEWHEMSFSWEDLSVLPRSWRSLLSQWRGIYYIFDTSDRKGYVGSAYGQSNLLGRWLNYAARGHGGNRLLKPPRDPGTFQFTILERVSPDMDPGDVIQLETSWKRRLRTYAPTGLNDN